MCGALVEEAMGLWKSLQKYTALLGVLALGASAGLLGGSTPAEAQTYVCPPGYYFLANYGCYPFGGYSYYAPPPTYYYYPPPAYYSYPQYGLSFRFGDHDRDHFDHDGGHFEHHH